MHLLLSKTRRWISSIRVVPFETETADGRSKERLRRVALTALVSAFAQAISMLTMLISVPLTLDFLGAERYGLWIAINSLIALLGFADLGMGNGLLNAIAEANGRNDRQAAKSYVSSAFYIVTGITLFFGVLWIIIYPRVAWVWLFNVKTPQAIAESGPAVSVFIWCMLLNLPLGLVQKIYDGYQEGYVNGLWRAGGSLFSLLNMLLAIHFQAKLPILVLAMAGSPVLASFFNAIVLFARERTWLRPSWKMRNRDASMRILRNGSLFFVLQLAVAVGFQSDNLVIARFLGASQVPQYAVPMKLFIFIPTLINFVLAPLWPAYGEAIVRRDVFWVRRVFKQSLLLSFGISFFFSLFLIVFGQKVIQLWVGDAIKPNSLLLFSLGLWVILLSLGNPISMLLNGGNVITFQIICAISMALSNLALSVFLVQRIGTVGPILGSVTAWLVFSLLPSAFYIPRLFESWNRIGSSN